MSYNQIYSICNQIKSNITYTGSNVIDTSSFVAFGTAALQKVNKEGVYNSLYDIIARTIFAIDEAEDSGRGIIVDDFEYGSILQKISYQTQDAETASTWDISNPQDPYTVKGKAGIVPRYFENDIPAFAWVDVAYDYQLREAFRDEQALAGFIDGLYIRMRNAYKVSKRGLEDTAIGALMGEIYEEATAVTPDSNGVRRVRHLLTEYNNLYGTSLTDATSRIEPKYLEYVRKQILIDRENFMRMTHLYNTVDFGGASIPIDRRTIEKDIKLDMSLDFSMAYSKYWGDTYNEKYVQLPPHNSVVNWGLATDTEKVTVSNDGGNTTITINPIIGFMYDKDAVVATMARERFISKYDEWNERNVFKLTAERRYCCDQTENAVMYLND